MFTCFIRYEIAPGKQEAFREQAHAWIALIRKYGGTHHGYFVPGGEGDALPEARFSFPGIGREGPPDIGVALFSFPSIAAYETYRRDVAEDAGCKAATARFNETKCFSGYERSFLVPLFEQAHSKDRARRAPEPDLVEWFENGWPTGGQRSSG